MAIFRTYSGNAMLNNALMTLEALGNLNNVSEITEELLLQLYEKRKLLEINKRLKSYTMLFTKNGPLHNDKTNGERIYDSLLKTILSSYENGGDKICEISGLRFSKTFEQIYQKALKKVGFNEKDIQKKDTSLNRTWFPLIGGLGSDAQALPQAKFSIQIHPICVAILQFLPLSSLLYNGGILLIDSSNFDLARRYIRENQKLLWEKIKTTPVHEQVENVKDFNKGHYILKAIEILEEKETFEETYSDLNLWSFSNSGTGASCSIDRVPNSLIRKLITIDKNSKIGAELKSILNNNLSSKSFLDDLEANKEWWLLYPNVFGSGKKEVRYPGVSVDFLERYFDVTGNKKLTDYAKYIAGLIRKYKTKSFEKYLNKYDAWQEKDYHSDLYVVLISATEKGEWTLRHQIQILDDKDLLPAKNNYYLLHKLIHFYYQKEHYDNVVPDVLEKPSNILAACNWLIAIIDKDVQRNKIATDLAKGDNYVSAQYIGLFIRAVQSSNHVSIENITTVSYNEDFNFSGYGLNELLRIHFLQPVQESITIEKEVASRKFTQGEKDWFNTIEDFSIDYKRYYYEKYKHRDTEEYPVEKFRNLIQRIPLETSGFLEWLKEAINNTNEYLFNKNGIKNKWQEDLILFNPNGEKVISFSKLAIKLSLTKRSSVNIEKEIFQ